MNPGLCNSLASNIKQISERPDLDPQLRCQVLKTLACSFAHLDDMTILESATNTIIQQKLLSKPEVFESALFVLSKVKPDHLLKLYTAQSKL